MAGELRVLGGDTLVAKLEVAAGPKLLVRDGEVAYVVGGKAMSLVDLSGPRVSGSIPLSRASQELVGEDDRPTELKVSSDGKRAFALYGLDNKVAVLDGTTGKEIARVAGLASPDAIAFERSGFGR